MVDLQFYSTKNKVCRNLHTLFLLLTSVLALNGCDQAHPGLKEVAQIKDSFSIKSDHASSIYPVNLRSFRMEGTVWISLLDPYGKKIHVLKYDEAQRQVVDSFEISIPVEALGRYGVNAYTIVSRDSIFWVPDNKKKEKKNTIFLINDKKEVLHKWKFTDSFPKGYSNYDLSPRELTFTKNKLIGMVYRDGHGYKNADGAYNLAEKLNYVYQYPSHFVVDIADSTISNPFAHYPRYALSKDKLYYETPMQAIDRKEKNMAFLFKRRPLIQLYDIESGEHLETKRFDFPGYEKSLPLNLDKGRNLGESRRINDIKSSRFMDFRAGLQGKRYYAMYEHPVENIKTADRVKGPKDKKREVLVFNEKLDLIKLYKVPNYKSYYGTILPGKDGFFLIKRKHNEKFTMVYFGS